MQGTAAAKCQNSIIVSDEWLTQKLGGQIHYKNRPRLLLLYTNSDSPSAFLPESSGIMRSPSSSMFVLCLVGLSVTQLIQMSRADLVDQTCRETPNYNLCVEALRSDPRSSGADVAGLAVVMMDRVKAKTMATLDRISELLGAAPAPDSKTEAALRRCAKLYDRAVLKADIPSAMEALRTGNPKFAEQGANDAANEADSCERAFSTPRAPITSFNRSVSNLSRLASAIIRLLLWAPSPSLIMD